MGIKRESLPNPHPERRVDAVFPPDEAAGDRCEQGGGPGATAVPCGRGAPPGELAVLGTARQVPYVKAAARLLIYGTAPAMICFNRWPRFSSLLLCFQ